MSNSRDPLRLAAVDEALVAAEAEAAALEAQRQRDRLERWHTPSATRSSSVGGAVCLPVGAGGVDAPSPPEVDGFPPGTCRRWDAPRSAASPRRCRAQGGRRGWLEFRAQGALARPGVGLLGRLLPRRPRRLCQC